MKISVEHDVFILDHNHRGTSNRVTGLPEWYQEVKSAWLGGSGETEKVVSLSVPPVHDPNA